jgi:hypothetical protein
MRGGGDPPAASSLVDNQDEVEMRQEKRQLSCDEQCEREKRNQRLVEAFGSRQNPIEAQYPVYSDELLASARLSPLSFIKKVEQAFRELIDSSKYVILLGSHFLVQC